MRQSSLVVRSIVVLLFASTLGACSAVKPGRTAFDEQQKSVLRQAKVLKLEVEEWHAPNSVPCDMSKQQIESFLQGRMQKTGLAIAASADQPHDALLQFGFGCYPAQLVGTRYVTGLPNTTRSPSVVLMVYSIDFLHKDLGRIFYSGRWDALAPHRINFQGQDFIDRLDDVILRHLERKP